MWLMRGKSFGRDLRIIFSPPGWFESGSPSMSEWWKWPLSQHIRSTNTSIWIAKAEKAVVKLLVNGCKLIIECYWTRWAERPGTVLPDSINIFWMIMLLSDVLQDSSVSQLKVCVTERTWNQNVTLGWPSCICEEIEEQINFFGTIQYTYPNIFSKLGGPWFQNVSSPILTNSLV